MTEDGFVQLTERAADRIRAYLKDRPEVPAIRLALVRTHCMGGRGHAYDLQIAESRDDDMVVESRGLTFRMDPTSATRLRGIQVDFVEDFQGSGFAFTNPNAAGKCPCGHHDLFR